MKTKEELTALKEEVETLRSKLAELTEDELKQVVGGLNEEDYQIINAGPYISPTLDGEGRPIGFVDSDDYIHPKTYETATP